MSWFGVKLALGLQIGAANRLLSAAEEGRALDVAQILSARPHLAPYAGFRVSNAALHRAAAAGDLEVCRAIIDIIKHKASLAETADLSAASFDDSSKKLSTHLSSSSSSSTSSPSSATKWQRLLHTVIDQRNSSGKTPLMLACEHGHANIVSYLLRQGANPLLTDLNNSRTALHHAAVGGHVDCLKILCSDSTKYTTNLSPSRNSGNKRKNSSGGGDGDVGEEVSRTLRDIVLPDSQVQSAKYIDSRAFGGLTALHLATVTGNLEAVQVLLKAGAATMVKTDSDAFIGSEFLLPGSSPLHIAVMIGNISIIHGLLQHHAELMMFAGAGERVDGRGRRMWEGSSRSDLRSVRNSNRKLPFHLARERGLTQVVALVDPRIPIDNALDVARDTEFGFGVKRLTTICSMALQRSLLDWLDDCSRVKEKEEEEKEEEVEEEEEKKKRKKQNEKKMVVPVMSVVGRKRGSNQEERRRGGTPSLPPPLATNGAAGIYVVGSPAGKRPSLPLPPTASTTPAYTPPLPVASLPPAVPAAEETTPIVHSDITSVATASSPFAQFAGTAATTEDAASNHIQAAQHQQQGSSSDTRSRITQSAPVTPIRPLLAAPAASTPPPTATTTAAAALEHSAYNEVGSCSAPTPPLLGIAASDRLELARMRSLHEYVGMLSVRSVPMHRRMKSAAELMHRTGSNSNSNTWMDGQVVITHKEVSHHRRSTSHGGGNTNQVRRTLSTLRDRILYSSPSTGGVLNVDQAAGTINTSTDNDNDNGDDVIAKRRTSSTTGCISGGEGSESSSQGEEEDIECGVCLQSQVEVAFSGCNHSLCIECCRNLTKQEKRPPSCPFCRKMIVGFCKL